MDFFLFSCQMGLWRRKSLFSCLSCLWPALPEHLFLYSVSAFVTLWSLLLACQVWSVCQVELWSLSLFASAGDLMGRAMQNLDRLLAMPYGCGEQNMVLFAPNIFILNYLKSTGQLTQNILEKATHFLESGKHCRLYLKVFNACLFPTHRRWAREDTV